MTKRAFKKPRWISSEPFKPHILDDIMLSQVKQWLAARFFSAEMTHCPCCNRIVKLYPRKITSQMVRSLAMLTHGPKTSVELTRGTKCKLSGEHHKLKMWGFIRYIDPPDGDLQLVITEEGRAFAYGMKTAPRYVLTYNEEVFGYSDEQVFVDDCIKEQFSLAELLNPDTINSRDWQVYQ